MSTQLGRLAPGQERVDLRNTRNANDIDIFTSHHDMPTTAASVQELLAGGTPDWVKRPEEYKNYAREAMQAEREISLDMVTLPPATGTNTQRLRYIDSVPAIQ